MHPLFLTGLICTGNYLQLTMWNGNSGMLLQYLATIVLTLAAARIMSCFKIAPYLGGTNSKIKLSEIKKDAAV
jgi:hypothetical protein